MISIFVLHGFFLNSEHNLVSTDLMWKYWMDDIVEKRFRKSILRVSQMCQICYERTKLTYNGLAEWFNELCKENFFCLFGKIILFNELNIATRPFLEAMHFLLSGCLCVCASTSMRAYKSMDDYYKRQVFVHDPSSRNPWIII